MVKLLEGKGWPAQNFYNEYLELKTKITEITKSIEFMEYRGYTQETEMYKIQLAEKVKRMRFVLEMLEQNKVSLKDLILLSMNVDVEAI